MLSPAARSVLPRRPTYAFLADKDLAAGDMREDLSALTRLGVPYTQSSIDKANDDLKAQADADADTADLVKRYPKAQVRDFDGDPARLTEMDALIAYLQMLGTLVDVEKAKAQSEANAVVMQPRTATTAPRGSR